MPQPQETWLYNTQTRSREKFVPREPGKVTLYSCGPTVYGLIHVGNLRAALTSDLLYRWLKHAGYQVTYTRNYTDVDDKIINRAHDEKVGPDDIAKKYTQEVEKDYAVAGMEEPTYKTKATEFIPEMVSMIEKIIANGKAYVAEDGEVIFSIHDFPEYGKLSGRNPDDLLAGARVEVSQKKKNPLDFTLWKPAKPGEPSWKSPWCDGRPGWHIECSAMASKCMGDQIDIHHGGSDLVFPHHENEVAQSEAASGKAPFVRYWVHNAMLNINSEKMSKSLGNVTQARDFLSRYGGEFTRYLLLSAHYRSILDLNPEALDQTAHALQRIYEAKKKAEDLRKLKAAMPDMKAESAWGEFVSKCEIARKEINHAFADDLNTPQALGALFTLIREFNRTVAMPKGEGTPSAVLGANQFIEILEKEIGAVLGIGRLPAEKMLGELDRIRALTPTEGGQDRPSPEEIEKLIEDRKTAKAQKDFKRADQIRDDLAQRGVQLKDTPGGTQWTYQ